MSANRTVVSRGLAILALLVATFGVYCRVSQLSNQAVWLDETRTLMCTFGHVSGETNALAWKGPFTAEDLRKIMLEPRGGVRTMLQAVTDDSTLHGPGYFLMARMWSLIFGRSVASIRGMSVLFGLAAIPLVWLLAHAMFDSARKAWWAAALVTISPMTVLYSGEARYYILYLLLAAVMSWRFWRAAIDKTATGWILYTATLVLSFYMVPISLLVVGAHTLTMAWMVIRRRDGTTRTAAIRFVLAVLATVVLFSPWLVVVTLQWTAVATRNSWQLEPVSFAERWHLWTMNLGRVLVDLGFGATIHYTAVCLGIASAFAVVWATARREAAVLLTALALTPFVFFAAPDLIEGGQRSTVARYQVVGCLVVLIAVGYACDWLLEWSRRHAGWMHSIAIVAVVTGMGVVAFSSFRLSISRTPWNKYGGAQAIAIADAVAGGDTRITGDVVLANRLAPASLLMAPTQRFAMYRSPEELQLAPGERVYLFNDRGSPDAAISSRYQLVPVVPDALWRLLPR